MKKLLGIVVLGLLWFSVGFATVEDEDALIKSGEIKVGMSFYDFEKLPFVFSKTRIVPPTEKEIQKKKFGTPRAVSGRDFYYIVSYLGLPYFHENIFVFKGQGYYYGSRKKQKKKTILVSIHKRSQKDFYSQFSNYDTWLEVEEFINKDQGHSLWKKNIKRKYSQNLDIAKNIDNLVRTEPEKGFIKFICVYAYNPIGSRHSVVEISFSKRIFKSYRGKEIFEKPITYLDDRKLEYDGGDFTGKLRISDNKLISKRVECSTEEKFSVTDIAKKPEVSPDDNKVVPAGSGSGFFVSSEGHIITNHHVIDGCNTTKVNFKGNQVDAQILAVDKTNDIAILKTNIKPNSIFPISNEDVSLLEDVVVAGYPLGKKVSSAIKTHKGVVTALAGAGDNYSNFQTDASINAGNSGGPIMNQKGNIVGIAVATWVQDGVQGVHFGIKSSTLKTFANSNSLKFSQANNRELSNKDLGKLITEATVYLECHMTVANIKKMIAAANNRKAFFSEFK
ncbi:serine protease [Candidatus Pelagibacter ubique]|nr:serine protease [Candidatus Pelagibacter ubique]